MHQRKSRCCQDVNHWLRLLARTRLGGALASSSCLQDTDWSHNHPPLAAAWHVVGCGTGGHRHDSHSPWLPPIRRPPPHASHAIAGACASPALQCTEPPAVSPTVPVDNSDAVTAWRWGLSPPSLRRRLAQALALTAPGMHATAMSPHSESGLALRSRQSRPYPCLTFACRMSIP